MARLFAPTRKSERIRVNANGVPIPTTPCQVARVMAAVHGDYQARRPGLIPAIQGEILIRVFAPGEPVAGALAVVAARYCHEYLNRS